MGRGRGLWDQAGAGDLDALATALAPGGDGDVHARNVDGENGAERDKRQEQEGQAQETGVARMRVPYLLPSRIAEH